MDERLLHFVWQHHYREMGKLKSTDGLPVEIIDPGLPNRDAGPDFFNAKIKIDHTVWVGNIEIHPLASDWFRHGHHEDPYYNNVILHVVVKADKSTRNKQGASIPTVCIPYPDKLEQSLRTMIGSSEVLPCAKELRSADSLTMHQILDRMLVERLQQQTERIFRMVKECNGSWEEAFYRSMTRSFGLKTNADPAEQLARSLPLRVLARHKDNLFQIEALFFGQAGLIQRFSNTQCNYLLSLKAEYLYLSKKFGLQPLNGNSWKFMRMRPSSFPTIRLAQLSMLVHRSNALFSKLLEAETFDSISQLLRIPTSTYWETHYTFGNESKKRIKRLGDSSIEIITLNTIVPFCYAYAQSRNTDRLRDKALALLTMLPFERNSTTRIFEREGITGEHAGDSQALVHLMQNYCNPKKCLFCPIGGKILRKNL